MFIAQLVISRYLESSDNDEVQINSKTGRFWENEFDFL